MDFLDLTGRSGRCFRYSANEGQLSPAGGNFALARPMPGGQWELIYVGEVESLMGELNPPQAEAAAAHGPGVRLFTRLNISRSVRREELEDVLAAYAPPMNAVQAV